MILSNIVVNTDLDPQEDTKKFWMMNFNETKSQSCMGTTIVLNWYPLTNNHCLSLRLGFEGTNNVDEYEVLLHGIELAKDYGIKILEIIGDFDLIVKGSFACKDQRLKRYKNSMWLAMESFNALSLQVVPRSQN